jgi:hypothetical protein
LRLGAERFSHVAAIASRILALSNLFRTPIPDAADGLSAKTVILAPGEISLQA